MSIITLYRDKGINVNKKGIAFCSTIELSRRLKERSNNAG